MSIPSRALLIAAVLGLAAVAGGPAACTEHSQAAESGAGRSYLVWEMAPVEPTEGEEMHFGWHGDMAPVTRWVTRDVDGSVRELGRRHGLWVVADGTLWQMGETSAKWETLGCEDYDGRPGDTPPRVTHESTGLIFQGRDGRRHDVLPAFVPEPPDPDATEDDALVVGDFFQLHTPVATLGSLVILRSDEYSYHCGAHGGVSVSYEAYDLATGKVVDLVGEATGIDIGPVRTAAMHEELREEDAWEGGEISLTAVYPRIVDGRLVARLQFTADTCYACSDGAWHSYTTSAEVAAPRLPDSLESHARPPAVVVKAIAGIDQETGFGWSEVPSDGPLRDEVSRLFQSIGAA